MCLSLTKNQTTPIIAKDDVVCYKHLLVKDGHYFTPYYKTEINFNKVFSSIIEMMNDGEAPYTHNIEEGLHSFANIEDCEQDLFSCFGSDGIEFRVIAKCIIPKGSTYYSGSFYYHSAFASSEIKYLEIIDTYDTHTLRKY